MHLTGRPAALVELKFAEEVLPAMTLKEAMDNGIKAVRQDPWNPYCRMELPVFPGRPNGIWGRVIDPCGNLALGKDAETPIDILLMEMESRLSVDPGLDK